MSIPKVWFITGASSGLGLSVLNHVLSKGDIAVATLRKPDVLADLATQYKNTQLVLPDEIKAAFAFAHKKFGRIDVVYSNAGYATLGEVEGTDDKDARNMFEANFWGSANVLREAIRFFREVNKPAGGRFLQASSIAGVSGMGALGYYSASKFAIEGLVEGISKEIHSSWNIKINLLQLGSFRTKAIRESMVIAPIHPAYVGGNSIPVREYFAGPQILQDISDSDKAAREIYNIANDNDTSLHVPLGLDALGIVSGKAAQINDEVKEAGKWSVDLKQDK
ncbi:NAD(P)-binding protein [Cyathus striatus]|nr:NAD(P)-binding protein [Cyathus striatus]